MDMVRSISKMETIIKDNISIVYLMEKVINILYLGTYIWASKAIYTGDFRDGKRRGYGVWKSGDSNPD